MSLVEEFEVRGESPLEILWIQVEITACQMLWNWKYWWRDPGSSAMLGLGPV